MATIAVDRINAVLIDRGAGWATVTTNGDWLVARADGEGFLLDLATGEVRTTFPAHPHLGPMPDPEGVVFVTASDGAVEIRGLPDAEIKQRFAAEPAPSIVTGRGLLEPGGDAVFLTVDPAGGWARYDVGSGEETASFDRVQDDETVSCFALSADGSCAVVGGIKGPVSEGFLAFYTAETGELIEHERLAYEIDRVALSADGADAVVCDGTGSLGGDGWRSDDLDGVVVDAQYIRGGAEVISVTARGRLDRWDAASGARLGRDGVGAPARVLSATDAGDLVALSGDPARVVAPEWSQ